MERSLPYETSPVSLPYSIKNKKKKKKKKHTHTHTKLHNPRRIRRTKATLDLSHGKKQKPP